ncbi:hypothetical protein J8273_6583 [Carpediemonas membranifera]|uniref:Uncharacterized protein n=1 Tax=Carpediemonas membranifera TaxID=201153 RepID=A0A8J6B0S3_9EUKA|nr:hypothetical protein J8273_6583 [Carpediemonas membranifera]|eukprot:KAG9391804.1 hypothetical protein J8273_6583 [Carpediemonas membranifera]
MDAGPLGTPQTLLEPLLLLDQGLVGPIERLDAVISCPLLHPKPDLITLKLVDIPALARSAINVAYRVINAQWRSSWTIGFDRTLRMMDASSSVASAAGVVCAGTMAMWAIRVVLWRASGSATAEGARQTRPCRDLNTASEAAVRETPCADEVLRQVHCQTGAALRPGRRGPQVFVIQQQKPSV